MHFNDCNLSEDPYVSGRELNDYSDAGSPYDDGLQINQKTPENYIYAKPKLDSSFSEERKVQPTLSASKC